MKPDLFSTLLLQSNLNSVIRRVIIGPLTVLVETDSGAGLSSCFRDPNSSVDESSLMHSLRNIKLERVIEWYAAGSLLMKSVAMATLNAILPTPPKTLPEMFGQSCLVEKTGNGHLVVVGNFPFLSQLEPHVGKLTLIQEDPHLGYRGVLSARTVFPQADVIVLTASAFVNGTMDQLLALTGNSFVMLLGATTPLNETLFTRGVDALCGVVIDDLECVVDGVIKGLSFKRLEGIRRVAWFKPTEIKRGPLQ